LLYDGRCAATNLRDLNDDDDDGLACYYVSSWFETCRTTLDLLGETLSLDDVVSNDETTHIGESRVIDEADLSSCRRKRHR